MPTVTGSDTGLVREGGVLRNEHRNAAQFKGSLQKGRTEFQP